MLLVLNTKTVSTNRKASFLDVTMRKMGVSTCLQKKDISFNYDAQPVLLTFQVLVSYTDTSLSVRCSYFTTKAHQFSPKRSVHNHDEVYKIAGTHKNIELPS